MAALEKNKSSCCQDVARNIFGNYGNINVLHKNNARKLKDTLGEMNEN